MSAAGVWDPYWATSQRSGCGTEARSVTGSVAGYRTLDSSAKSFRPIWDSRMAPVGDVHPVSGSWTTKLLLHGARTTVGSNEK